MKNLLIPAVSFGLALLMALVSGPLTGLARRQQADPTGCQCEVRLTFPDPSTAKARGWLLGNPLGGDIVVKYTYHAEYNGSRLYPFVNLKILIRDMEISNSVGDTAEGSAFGNISHNRNEEGIEGQPQCDTFLTHLGSDKFKADDGADLSKAILRAAQELAHANNLGNDPTYDEPGIRAGMAIQSSVKLKLHVRVENEMPDGTRCEKAGGLQTKLSLDESHNGNSTFN